MNWPNGSSIMTFLIAILIILAILYLVGVRVQVG